MASVEPIAIFTESGRYLRVERHRKIFDQMYLTEPFEWVEVNVFGGDTSLDLYIRAYNDVSLRGRRVPPPRATLFHAAVELRSALTHLLVVFSRPLMTPLKRLERLLPCLPARSAKTK